MAKAEIPRVAVANHDVEAETICSTLLMSFSASR
jgi:hypothetical protein